MKILVVSTDFPYLSREGTVTQGGGGACVAQLLGELKKPDFEVTLVSRSDPDAKKEIYDFEIHRTLSYDFGIREAKFTHVLSSTLECIKILKKQKFDLVHSHNPTAGVTGCVISHLYGIPHVMTLHGPWADVRQNRVIKLIAYAMEFFTSRFATLVTCDSGALARDIKSRYGVESRTIPNAVDTHMFRPGLMKKEEARKRLGIDTNDLLVLYTGRFIEEKGLTYLLDAARSVLQGRKGITFLLVGGGFDERMVSDWLASNPKLKDSILTIPYLNYESMSLTYSAADVFVLPTLAEGLSRSILEAMACGLPVIATDVGGNSELVNKDTGLLVRPRSSKDISQAIIKLSKDTALRKRLGENATAFIRKNFSVDKRVRAFKNIYAGMKRK